MTYLPTDDSKEAATSSKAHCMGEDSWKMSHWSSLYSLQAAYHPHSPTPSPTTTPNPRQQVLK